MNIPIIGIDPSLRHWGMVQTLYTPQTNRLKAVGSLLIEPVLPTGKHKQNSLDVLSAEQLFEKSFRYINQSKAKIICVELPIGSKSSRAMASYGVCMGVIGSLQAFGFKVVQISPYDVKAIVGSKNASKHDVIQWAINQHEELILPSYKRNGKQLITESKAEHICDALLAVHAGLNKPIFHQYLKEQSL